jgi:hypothetical protein
VRARNHLILGVAAIQAGDESTYELRLTRIEDSLGVSNRGVEKHLLLLGPSGCRVRRGSRECERLVACGDRDPSRMDPRRGTLSIP